MPKHPMKTPKGRLSATKLKKAHATIGKRKKAVQLGTVAGIASSKTP